MTPFKSKYRITQLYGVNPDYYKKFGLKAHEGIDLVPTGTQLDVLSLADGIVVKDEDNAKSGAYGINCTVWSPTLGLAFQYCHLSTNTVRQGELVTKGQLLGSMGATGNTQGAHLHLNQFLTDSNGIRLHRDNGYLGGVDPLPYLEKDPEIQLDVYTQLDACRIARDSHWNDLRSIQRDLGVPGDYSLMNVSNRIMALQESERELGKQSKLNQELNLQIATLNSTSNSLAIEISDTRELLEMAEQKITDLEEANTEQVKQIEELKKMQPIDNESAISLISRGLAKLLGK